MQTETKRDYGFRLWGEPTEWEEKDLGLKFVARWHEDGDSRPDYIGKFTSRPYSKDGRANHPNPNAKYDSTLFPYIALANSFEDHVKSGASEEDARKYVQQDIDRLAAWGNDEWSFVGISVSAYLVEDDECEMELAGASLWGIESDSEDDRLNEVVDDLRGEAISQLKRDLRLRAEKVDRRHQALLSLIERLGAEV